MTTIDLDTLTLTRGWHATRGQGVCLMEAVAWWAGQEHTDHPPCVSPVLANFGMNLNDKWDDRARQQLKPLIPLLPGTVSDGADERRRYMALDWLVRVYLPVFLDLVPGLAGDAAAVRALVPVTDLVSAELAGPVVRQARGHAAAAGAAAGAAAWAAAGDAAWAAAGDAAGDAAWDAAGAAAGDAAWDAAWAAAWAAARDAARDAAWDAAWDALSPTVAQLQDSAIALYDVLIAGEWPA
jgi:hypothetical protein